VSEVRGRRGIVAAVAVILAIGVAGLVALLVLSSGSSDRAIATETMRLVPANALVALHLSTDRGRTAVRGGARVAGRLPSWPRIQRDLTRRVSAAGCGIDLRRRPGRELTFALLPARGGSSTPLLVTDAPARGVSAAPSPCGALVVRKVAGLVVIGEPAGVAAAAEVAAGRRPALVTSPVYRTVARGLPDSRVLDAWASARGTRDLLTPLGGLYATLAGLVDTDGLRGAAAALTTDGDGARFVIRRVAVSAAPVAPFRATLQDEAPADTLTYVASGDLGSGLQRWLLLAAPGAGSPTAAAAARLEALGRRGRETATLVAPGEKGPAVTLVSHVRRPAAVRAAMTALEPALATLIGADAGVAWRTTGTGSARTRTLGDAATAPLAWALDGTTLILSTAPGGIATVRGGGPRLAQAPGFRAVTGNLRNPINSLVFLDPKQLLRLGADTGISPVGALNGSRTDLARVRSIGVTTTGTSRLSTVELSLWIP
jgi:hypothetical protein